MTKSTPSTTVHYHHNIRIVPVDNHHQYKVVCRQCNNAYVRWAKQHEYDYMQQHVLPQQRFTLHDLNHCMSKVN